MPNPPGAHPAGSRVLLNASRTGQAVVGAVSRAKDEASVHSFSPDAVYGIASLTCAAARAICDVRTRRIPNWITAPGLLLGLPLHLALGGWRSLLGSAVAGLAAGLLFLLFYLAGGMGAGDVKLMAAVCCLAGVRALPHVLVGTAIAGGLAAVLLALLHGRASDTMANVARLIAYHGRSG